MLKRKVEGVEKGKEKEVPKNATSLKNKNPSRPLTIHENEEGCAYNTTSKIGGTSNTPIMVGGSHKDPFVDNIMETHLLNN